MSSHADILDRPEPLGTSFVTSLTLHALLVAGIIVGTIVEHQSRMNLGSPNGGGIGVLVAPVASIPLPNRGGPTNPVANDTQSQVPTPPAPKEKAKAPPKPKPPTPDEILLSKMEKAPQRKSLQPAAQPNKFREQQTDKPNQLYSEAGQRLSSPAFGQQGGGGIHLGDSSPFGEQFGAYANIVRENIARNWKPTTQGAKGASVMVMFTIQHDGSVTNVKIGKSSGNQVMDFSAQRAVDDAKLPPLPAGFPRNQADVQLTFELGN